MNRSEEFTFAWNLLDMATFLEPGARVQLCVRIGAGEYRETIIELLQHFRRVDTALPPAMAASLWAWMNGFAGSDSEIPLRDLASGIRVSPDGAQLVAAVERPTPEPLVPRRSAIAARRLVLAE